jgi:hypothetical protein
MGVGLHPEGHARVGGDGLWSGYVSCARWGEVSNVHGNRTRVGVLHQSPRLDVASCLSVGQEEGCVGGCHADGVVAGLPCSVVPYMERSAMRGFVPCTWVEKSVFPIPATSFTLMVLRELAAREKGAWAFAPEDVM